MALQSQKGKDSPKDDMKGYEDISTQLIDLGKDLNKTMATVREILDHLKHLQLSFNAIWRAIGLVAEVDADGNTRITVEESILEKLSNISKRVEQVEANITNNVTSNVGKKIDERIEDITNTVSKKLTESAEQVANVTNNVTSIVGKKVDESTDDITNKVSKKLAENERLIRETLSKIGASIQVRYTEEKNNVELKQETAKTPFKKLTDEGLFMSPISSLQTSLLLSSRFLDAEEPKKKQFKTETEVIEWNPLEEPDTKKKETPGKKKRTH